MQNKYCKVLLAVCCIGLFVTNFSALAEQGTPTVATPKNQADCVKLNGKWGKVGIYPQPICNLPTSDANKVCNDVSECEGTCLATLSKEQIEQTWRGGATIYTSGKCTAWRLTVGCMPKVRAGKVKGLFCQD